MTTLADQLRVIASAADHAPDAHAAWELGRLAMYVRTFDRHHGRPLPADWRTRIDWTTTTTED